ncbi:MAG: hypothetical protein ACTHNO_10370 [Ralstonia sp.]|uniref:Uncharacterized protein n=1 Tax=Ralstonia chuxiongensis TaxID=2957504 RepID=A0AA41WN06_9RALS|nr:hypothetical protein [Ralstonia chuxiongensis]MCP1172045.1 hypothetical protein [Ralstonia chuxiongensis]
MQVSKESVIELPCSIPGTPITPAASNTWIDAVLQPAVSAAGHLSGHGLAGQRLAQIRQRGRVVGAELSLRQHHARTDDNLGSRALLSIEMVNREARLSKLS